MKKCEHNTLENHSRGKAVKVRCSEVSLFVDENNRSLCRKHFLKWYKRKFKLDYSAAHENQTVKP